MTFADRIQQLADAHLADARSLDIVGFIDGIFELARQGGAIEAVAAEQRGMRLFQRTPVAAGTREATRGSAVGASTDSETIIEHSRGPMVLRVMCARLATIAREGGAGEDVVYEGDVMFEYPPRSARRWHLTFANHPGNVYFLLRAAD